MKKKETAQSINIPNRICKKTQIPMIKMLLKQQRKRGQGKKNLSLWNL
ncbi:MAG: hypothetical protein MR922_08125 [Lachnospiraceae bacterium]|nr:hypothetical protein [Lachnospiraceae bacterium]